MKKSDVLAILDRRITEAHEIASNDQYPAGKQERARGAYHALLQVKFEIEDLGTRCEGRSYLTIV